MIFAASTGSEGGESEHYSLYVPFNVAPGHAITVMTAAMNSILGLDVTIIQLEYHYAFTVTPFHCESDAKEFFPKLISGILWLSLKHRMGISYPSALAPIKINDKPSQIAAKSFIRPVADEAGWTEIDGHYNSDVAVVVPEHLRLLRWQMGQATVIRGLGSENALASLTEALSFEHPESVIDDKKLSLAIRLYSMACFERRNTVRFIAFITVLEALIPTVEISGSSRDALDAAMIALKNIRDEYDNGSEMYVAMAKLISRIGNLKNQSVGAAMEHYMSAMLSNHGDLGDVGDITKKLRQLYEQRSRLLHDGYADDEVVAQGVSFLNEFIPDLLHHLYVESASS